MKYIVAIALLLLFSSPVFATSDLMCTGKEYDVYMGVGVDRHGNGDVGFASIKDKNTNKTTEFYSERIKTIDLKWLDGEEDFSKNSMDVELTQQRGEIIKVTAKGRNGKLNFKSKSYTIDCDWEM